MLQGKSSANKKKGLFFEIVPVKWRVPSCSEELFQVCYQCLQTSNECYLLVFVFLFAEGSSKQKML